MNLQKVSKDRLLKDPNNARQQAAPEEDAELLASVRLHGIQVPLIGYSVPNGIMIADGHRRFDSGSMAGVGEYLVLVLSTRPEPPELLLAQLTINGHRQNLNPVDEYVAFARLAELKHWTLSQLAEGLSVSNDAVTRVMAIGKLSDEERGLVRQGKISKSAAYALSRMAPEQRATMARKAATGEVNRDDLNRQVRRPKKGVQPKTRRISCQLSAGTLSVTSADGLNLVNLIELLEEVVRECRKSRTLGLDITTAMQILRDRNKSQVATI